MAGVLRSSAAPELPLAGGSKGAAGGSVSVEIQDGQGKPVKGYRLQDCDPLTADAVHHIVTWKGKDDVGELAGHDLKVRFVLRKAKLYAFQFVGTGPRH